MNDGARPKFHKPRPIPFAMKEAELDCLERAGIVEKATGLLLLFVSPKRVGINTNLCGDYRVTVNSVLDVEQYPLPRPEELFAKLAGGKTFTTLDLSQAYNQLVLEEDSRKYLTINTHRDDTYEVNCS